MSRTKRNSLTGCKVNDGKACSPASLTVYTDGVQKKPEHWEHEEANYNSKFKKEVKRLASKKVRQTAKRSEDEI